MPTGKYPGHRVDIPGFIIGENFQRTLKENNTGS
jgi:hypothetical protein